MSCCLLVVLADPGGGREGEKNLSWIEGDLTEGYISEGYLTLIKAFLVGFKDFFLLL